MSDAVLIGLMLASLVLVFLFMWWDIDVTRRKAERWIHVERIRQERLDEDWAWTLYHADLQARVDATIAACEAAGAVDRINELLATPPHLEVVA